MISVLRGEISRQQTVACWVFFFFLPLLILRPFDLQSTSSAESFHPQHNDVTVLLHPPANTYSAVYHFGKNGAAEDIGLANPAITATFVVGPY